MQNVYFIYCFMKRKSCECNTCRNACKSKPGWFLPSQIPTVAEFLKITEQELFDNYLCVDFYKKTDEEYYVLSPGLVSGPTGSMFPTLPVGTCIFYKNKRCMIHPVAPHECQLYLHDSDDLVIKDRHYKVAKSWQNKNNYLTQLLGKQPHLPNIHDFFNILREMNNYLKNINDDD